jgi:uncharacterized protein YdaU (DUF1376 family)
MSSERVEFMTLQEEGAYRRALDKAWKEGSIPADPKACAARIGKGCPARIAEVVLRMFSPMPGNPDRMISRKLEKVRKEQKSKHETNSRNGKKGAENRWKKKTSGDSPAIATPMQGQWQKNRREEKRKEEEKELSNESSKKTKSAASVAVPTRIPKPFPITPEMYAWLAEEFPEGFDHKTAHENFIEYWTNETGAKALKLDWNLTWKKGMRLAKKWQDEDRNAASGKNGTGHGKSNLQVSRERDYSKFEGLDPIEEFGTPKRG